MLGQNAYGALLAAAATLTLITGQFDLSIGANAGSERDPLRRLRVQARSRTGPAVLLIVLVGAAVGLLNGLLVTYGKINAFIVTLGVGGALGGVAEWVSHGQTSAPEGFRQL